MEVLSSRAPLQDFAKALSASSLTMMLSNPSGPNVTVLVSSKAALESAAQQMQMSPEWQRAPADKVDQLMRYNVLQGSLSAAAMARKKELLTIGGSPVYASVDPETGEVTLDGLGSSARVVAADYLHGCSFTIHALDGVLLPMPGTDGANPRYTKAFTEASTSD
ncbi:hypothetical protein H632_c2308p1 [Helicosporidium sp. ATCC 50920]|nr:hypothetical protein H632_c2308p1 [Helicosporidium sp. ATCC 50920]|eukprot:KDD73317.1 hypothetical protein H632_c2308p1 [Helicosporidium sp. ATCC 50920]